MMPMIHDIFANFLPVFAAMSTMEFVIILVQVLILLTSLTLLALMLRFRGKLALDLALLWREGAIILLIGRMLVWRAWGADNEAFNLFTYLFFAAALVAVIVFLVREHVVYRDYDDTRSPDEHTPPKG